MPSGQSIPVGTVFNYSAIKRFRELRFFTKITGAGNAYQEIFTHTSLAIVETPVKFTSLGYSAIPGSCVVIIHASTYNSSRTRWVAKVYYVQDEYIANFPVRSNIKKWSDFATDYPEEKPIVIDY